MVCDYYAAFDHRLFKITSMFKEAACGPSHPCRVTTPVSHLTELHAAAWTNFLIAECGGGLLWPWLGQRHPLKWNLNHTFLSRYGNPRGWQRLIWTHMFWRHPHTDSFPQSWSLAWDEHLLLLTVAEFLPFFCSVPVFFCRLSYNTVWIIILTILGTCKENNWQLTDKCVSQAQF